MGTQGSHIDNLYKTIASTNHADSNHDNNDDNNDNNNSSSDDAIECQSRPSSFPSIPTIATNQEEDEYIGNKPSSESHSLPSNDPNSNWVYAFEENKS
jgi:hypothetical protein